MRTAGLFALALLVFTAPPPAQALSSDAVREDLLKVDALVRRSQRRTKAITSDDLTQVFRESPTAVTVTACSRAKDKDDLLCEFNDYSLHALSAANVDDLQLLGGESLKSLFALRRSDPQTLPTDFEVFCYAVQVPKLFDVAATAPYANTAFETAFSKLVQPRCKTPDLASAQAFISEALPLLAKTCQIESDGARRQHLKAVGEHKWVGVTGDCDSARFDLHYERSKKTGDLTRTEQDVKGGDKCEDVFGDPLSDKIDDDNEPLKTKKSPPRPPLVLAKGSFETSACDYVRWSETFPFLTINLDDGAPKGEAADARYEAAMTALFENDYDTAIRELNIIVKGDARNGLAHMALGIAFERTGKVDAAVKEFTTSIPLVKGRKIGHTVDGQVVGFLHRGATNYEHGKAQAALDDFKQAAALEPTSFTAHFWSAAALGALKRDKEAVAAFQRALSLRQSFERVTEFIYGEFGDAESMLADFVTPPREEMLNAAAWRLAVSKDAAARDGAVAVAYAQQACELTDNHNGRYLDTLSVAYAAAGQFKEAIATQGQALEQLTAEGADKDELAATQARLALFKESKAFTE